MSKKQIAVLYNAEKGEILGPIKDSYNKLIGINENVSIKFNAKLNLVVVSQREMSTVMEVNYTVSSGGDAPENSRIVYNGLNIVGYSYRNASIYAIWSGYSFSLAVAFEDELPDVIPPLLNLIDRGVIPDAFKHLIFAAFGDDNNDEDEEG